MIASVSWSSLSKTLEPKPRLQVHSGQPAHELDPEPRLQIKPCPPPQLTLSRSRDRKLTRSSLPMNLIRIRDRRLSWSSLSIHFEPELRLRAYSEQPACGFKPEPRSQASPAPILSVAKVYTSTFPFNSSLRSLSLKCIPQLSGLTRRFARRSFQV